MSARWISLIVIGGLLLTSSVSSAATRRTTTPAVTDASRINNLHTRGAAEIDRRLAALNKLLARVNSSTKLSAESKEILVKEIQGEVTGLTSLKTKLAADTDLTTLRTDIAALVTEYKTYRFIAPKVAMLTAAEAQANAVERLTALAAKLEAKLNDTGSKGQDQTTIKAAMADMKAKLAAVPDLYKSVASSFGNVTVEQYNSNPKILATQRAELITARENLRAARADAKIVLEGLKGLSVSSSDSSLSPGTNSSATP